MKRHIGQFVLIVGVGLLLLSAASYWFGWFGGTATPIVSIVAIIFTLAGRLLTAFSPKRE